MGSNSKKTKRIRRNKTIASGSGRKRLLRRDQRVQSEKRLQEALGEHIPLPSVRA